MTMGAETDLHAGCAMDAGLANETNGRQTMKPSTTARERTETGNAVAADRRDIWRDILSGEATGPDLGEAGLEPLLDCLTEREGTR